MSTQEEHQERDALALELGPRALKELYSPQDCIAHVAPSEQEQRENQEAYEALRLALALAMTSQEAREAGLQ